MTWTLAPDNSPSTTLSVNKNSRRCGAAELDQTECGLSCRASERSGCAGLPSFEDCVTTCVGNNQFFEQIFPACVAQNSAVNACTAGLPAGPANWQCIDGFGAFPGAACAPQVDALNTCLSQ